MSRQKPAFFPVMVFAAALVGCAYAASSPTAYSSIPATISSAATASFTPGDLRPPGEGFYLVAAEGLTALPGLADDSVFDLGSLPEINEIFPTFAVKGNKYPLGNLHLNPYVAGIGVDVTYGDSGARINRVFDHSPAEAAGLQAGELILSVNGQRPERPMIHAYAPGRADLFGIMYIRITLAVVSGTNSRTVELPRTYRANVLPETASTIVPQNIRFQLEPVGDYVLIQISDALQPGVYRFEFLESPAEPPELADSTHPLSVTNVPNPTPSPTPTPAPTDIPIVIPPEKWVFIIHR
jgi:hypothetical protein